MPDAGGQSEWDRVAALIEECRAEREACASFREQCRQSDVLDRSVYAAVRERLLAGVGEIQSTTQQDDPGP